jgi:thymidylate kinase
MIVLVEGHRHSGKTFLMESFFKENTDPKIHYYKFAFAKYIDELGMRDQETGPGVHYFSIANVMTILELNQTLLKDEVIVFDRSIFSAYVWSIYRERMDKERLILEFEKILTSDLWQNCKILYVKRPVDISTKAREKDYFGNFENAKAEKDLFDELFSRFIEIIDSKEKSNRLVRFTNNFDPFSEERFRMLLNQLANN